MSDTQLLNLLSFPNSLQHLLVDLGAVQALIARIAKVEGTVGQTKLIQADNFYGRFEHQLDAHTKAGFREWLMGNLRRLHELGHDGLPLLCLKLHLVPDFAEDSVRAFLRRELVSGNFYMGSKVYSNSVGGLSGEIREMVELVLLNRVLVFVELDGSVRAHLLSSLLGAVLVQGDEALLEHWQQRLGQQLLEWAASVHELAEPEEFELYMLLKVAARRLKHSSALQQLIHSLEQKHPHIGQHILSQFDHFQQSQLHTHTLNIPLADALPGLRLPK